MQRAEEHLYSHTESLQTSLASLFTCRELRSISIHMQRTVMSHADEVHVVAMRCIDSISIHMQRAQEHLEKVLAGIEVREGRTSRLGATKRRR